MRERLFSLFALTILFFSFVLSGCAVHSSSFPAVKNGVLDASRWNFTTQGPIKLNGEWKFYWKQFTIGYPKRIAFPKPGPYYHGPFHVEQ